MTEPCLCGADDCKHCHPENFKYGQYIPPEGDVYDADEVHLWSELDGD